MFDGPENSRGARGLVLGRDINLRPEPPAKDFLNAPLILTKLPRISLPVETYKDRMSAFFLRTLVGYREQEYNTMWRIRLVAATLMASVSSAAARELRDAGWVLGRNGKNIPKMVRLTHPHQIQDAFSTVMAAPEVLAKDARALEILLTFTLRQYLKDLSLIVEKKFSFDSEAYSCFMLAFEKERGLKNVTDPNERFSVIQMIYNNYYHASAYYIYSIIARERSTTNKGKIFSMYVRALFFMSRVNFDASMADAINKRRLPLRREIMFIVKRDRYLQERYNSDSDFATEIKNVVAFFPTRR